MTPLLPLAALVLLVARIVLLPLNAAATTVSMFIAYDAAVRHTTTTMHQSSPWGSLVLGSEDAVRPQPDSSRINEYDGARLGYAVPSNTGVTAGVRARHGYDGAREDADPRAVRGKGAIYDGPAATTAAEGAAAVNNAIPTTLARVIPANLQATTLGLGEDVFVTDAAALLGLNGSQIAGRLGIPESPRGFNVFEFRSECLPIASPVNRLNPGFVGEGLTIGGAPEFVIPNGPIPPGTFCFSF